MVHATTLAVLAGLAALARARDAYVCGTDGFPGSDASQNLTYDANAYNPDGMGRQCVAIFNTPPSFDATWFWTEDGTSVHSYPYVNLHSSQLPVVLANISSLTLSASWGMGVDTDSVSTGTIDASGLASHATVANVAFDMMADQDPAKAGNATLAASEIMIWLGQVGVPRPIGYTEDRGCYKQKLGNTEFILYQGQNRHGTNVFSWLAQSNVTKFKEDISPLLQYLWRNRLLPSNSSLGLIEFGTEAYHANSNVTFSASGFDLDLQVGTSPDLDLEEYPTKKCSSSRSSSGGGASVATQYSAAFMITVLASILVL